MPRIRSGASIGEKWKRRTETAGAEYEAGVKDPKKDWGEETAKSEKNYEAGVQNAMRHKRFGKGVKKAGTAKWQDGAVKKGVARFGQGVAASGDNYEKGFSPFREVIEKTELPPRYAKGDPRNFERVKAMGTALHDAKMKV
jgi:hypothetical protein